MKKLIILLLFSATMFAQEKKEVVILEKKQAKSVVKDLVEGDYCEKELSETKQLVTQLEQKVVVAEKETKNVENQNDLYKFLTASKDNQIDLLKKQLSEANLRKWGNRILLYGSLLLSGYLLIYK